MTLYKPGLAKRHSPVQIVNNSQDQKRIMKVIAADGRGDTPATVINFD
jgi:hypothetical protein